MVGRARSWNVNDRRWREEAEEKKEAAEGLMAHNRVWETQESVSGGMLRLLLLLLLFCW